jgi:hypothetical protein
MVEPDDKIRRTPPIWPIFSSQVIWLRRACARCWAVHDFPWCWHDELDEEVKAVLAVVAKARAERAALSIDTMVLGLERELCDSPGRASSFSL